MISSYIFTFLCLSGSIWGVGVIRAAAYTMPAMTSSCCVITGCCPQHFPTTPWTLNWPSSLPVACQSQESHLYASKPLGWSLTLQSSVNYPVTDNLANNQAGNQTTLNCQFRTREARTSPSSRARSCRPSDDTVPFLYLFIYLLIYLSAFFSGEGSGGGGRGLLQPSIGTSFWLSKWDFPGGPQYWHICSYALICFSSLCEMWPWSPF